MDAKQIGSILGGIGGEALLPGAGGMIGSQIGGAIGGSIGSGGSGSSGSSNGSGGSLGLPMQSSALPVGIIQMLQGQEKKNQANSYMPEYSDPTQLALLSEIAQKRKAMETGAEFASGMNSIGASMAGTNNAIVQSGAGDVSGTIAGLLKSQRVGNDAKNQVLANGQQNEGMYNNMYMNMLDKIAARKMQLQLYKSQQAQAEWAQKSKEGFANAAAGSSYLGGSGGGGNDFSSILSNIGGGGAPAANQNLDAASQATVTPGFNGDVSAFTGII